MQSSKIKLRKRKDQSNHFKTRNQTIPVKIKERKKQMVLEDLFEESLKKMYHSELSYQRILPLLLKSCESDNLKSEFSDYSIQTEHQIGRLDKIFDRLELTDAEAAPCKAMDGMIAECNEIINDLDRGNVRDAALIISVQKIQHYGIAVYGSLRELAEILSYNKIADALERTLDEKKNNDKMLTRIAQDVNEDAFEMAEEEEEDIML